MNNDIDRAGEPEIGFTTGLVMTVVIVVLTAGLVTIGIFLGIAEFMFAGFVFIVYWTGIKHSSPDAFLPTLYGALGGLAMAWSAFKLIGLYGVTGGLIAIALVSIIIFLLVRKLLPSLVNDAFMLMLTVTLISMFKSDAHYVAAACAILIAALYSGGIILLLTRLAKRSGQ